MDKKSIVGHVKQTNFGYQIGDTQNTDELYDPAMQPDKKDGLIIRGKGAQGGGSKPTPQAQRMTTGSGIRGGHKTTQIGSYPKNPQRLRG